MSAHATDTQETTSDRYEFSELFPEEGTDTQHLLMVAGVVGVVVVLAAVFIWTLGFLG